MASESAPQLRRLVAFYHRFLPRWAFPVAPFIIAALFQVFAWFGGRYLVGLTLVPRVLVLWMFALGEYSFMSPAMNASQEILGMQENVLIVMYNAATLAVFAIVSTFVFKNNFTWRHVVALALLCIAVALVNF
jgi:uncharacterized protein (DUF486 family)